MWQVNFPQFRIEGANQHHQLVAFLILLHSTYTEKKLNIYNVNNNSVLIFWSRKFNFTCKAPHSRIVDSKYGRPFSMMERDTVSLPPTIKNILIFQCHKMKLAKPASIEPVDYQTYYSSQISGFQIRVTFVCSAKCRTVFKSCINFFTTIFFVHELNYKIRRDGRG